MSTKIYYGTGRRKTSTARIQLTAGKGVTIINGEKVTENRYVKEPLQLAGSWGQVNLSIKVRGGGKQGQLEAIQHGIANALVKFQPDTRSTLRKAGMLTRDPRQKERKKYGLKKARRAPQWSKR